MDSGITLFPTDTNQILFNGTDGATRQYPSLPSTPKTANTEGTKVGLCDRENYSNIP
jgi:hypothetical protein